LKKKRRYIQLTPRIAAGVPSNEEESNRSTIPALTLRHPKRGSGNVAKQAIWRHREKGRQGRHPSIYALGFPSHLEPDSVQISHLLTMQFWPQ
jgi:hypothetical protein